MKRVGNLYEELCSIENLMLAHANAKRGKSYYKEVREVESNMAKYLYALQDSLVLGNYKTSEYEVFERVDKNKTRVIYKLPYYPDRICQWAIIQVIEKYLIRTMTKDTYSAIPGRGTYCAYLAVKESLRDVAGTKWCLKVDVRKFYPSIDHNVLKNKYRRMFKDKQLIKLLDEIIDSTKGNVGIPIGNYISQYSGNIYLIDFDHWVKEQLRVEHYFRYMDDMVFLGATKERMWEVKREISKYLKEKLKLEINPNWQVFRVEDRGIDFVGYVFKHNEIRLRKSIAQTLKKTSRAIARRVNNGKMMTHRQYCAINSLKGWAMRCTNQALVVKYVDTLQYHMDEYYEANVKGKGVRRCRNLKQ